MLVVVLATAVRTSGGLSIYRQFLYYLEQEIRNDRYIIFIDSSMDKLILKNVEFVETENHNPFYKLWWENIGLMNWMKKKEIKPDVIVSLQNLAVRSKIPQLVYYHQSIPFFNVQWNPFKKEQRSLFFYKNIYPFFVRCSISKRVIFVVQTPFIKHSFLEYFSLSDSRVRVLKPDIKDVDSTLYTSYSFEEGYTHFLFPATPFIYKDHDHLVETLRELKGMNEIRQIRIHFTFNREDNLALWEKIQHYNLTKYFVFEGVQSQSTLYAMYKSASGLLFPSYIETLGLPLLEAASFGLPILVSDLPYSRDVIGSYSGAIFLPLKSIDAWSKGILSIVRNPCRFKPMRQNIEKSSWSVFFELIRDLANKNIKYNL